MAWMIISRSPVRRVGGDVRREGLFPSVAVREQLLLVVEELLAGLGRKFEIGALDDRIDRAGLLAEAAIDALGHVDVVARGAPAAVVARLRLDGDGEGRADCLAKLAGNAALFAVRIATQGVLAPEARRERPALIGIVQRHLFLED